MPLYLEGPSAGAPYAGFARGGFGFSSICLEPGTLILDDSQVVLEYSQFALEAMLGVLYFEAILEDQFCFFGGSAQFRMLIDVAGGQGGGSHALQAVFQLGDALYDLGRGRLRLDVAIERDFAFDLLNVLGDSSFAVVLWMNDSRNNACQWIGICHGTEYKSESRRVECLAERAGKEPLPLIRGYNRTMQHSKLVVVQSYGSRPEADLAKGALEDAGIPAMLSADTAGRMREHLAWSGAGFKVLVREEDVTAARDVLTPPAEGADSLGPDFQTDDDPPPSWRRFT